MCTYYVLDKDCHIVEGATKDCIYDVNKGYLYASDKESTRFIKSLSRRKNPPIELLNEDEQDLYEHLIKIGLLNHSDVPRLNFSIKSAFNNDPKINFAWIELTRKCNLKCIHCYEESDPNQDGVLSFNDYKSIITDLVKFGIKDIQFIGGEPLLIGDKLKKFLSLSAQNFRSIEIFTNGTLIKDKHIQWFKKYSIRVALSVYSYSESEHAKVTLNQRSLSKTNEAIKKLASSKIPYRVANIRMNGINIGQKNHDLYDLESSYKTPIMAGRASSDLFNNEIITHKLITEETFSKRLNLSFLEDNVIGHSCFGNRIYIDHLLNVYPCVMERRISHGNLYSHSIFDVIDNSITSLNKDQINECRECEFRYACRDCRPDTSSENYYSKPWFCTYSPKNGTWSNYLNQN